MEVVVVIAIFGVFLWIIVVLTSDMRTWEKKMPVNLMSHPMVSAVVSRVRKDVLDACGDCNPFPESLGGTEWSRGDRVLIVETMTDAGGDVYAVWDFSKPGEVTRMTFIANQEQSRWTAHGTPAFTVSYIPPPEIKKDPDAIEIKANDDKGKLGIDQVYFPRAH